MSFTVKVSRPSGAGENSRLLNAHESQPAAPTVTSFAQDFAAATASESHPTVQAALRQWFPDCLATHRAHQDNDRIGVDIWVERPMARMTAVDLKIRSVDYGAKYGLPMDAALEISYGNGLGWAMKPTATQMYLFVCTDTGRNHAFDAVLLRQALTENLPDWRDQFKVITTRTASSYGGEPIKSEAVCVPVTVLAAACKAIQARGGAAA